MPHLSANEALHFIRTVDAEVPFIFVSGTIGEDTAVAAMRNGAQDYVMKSYTPGSRCSARVARRRATLGAQKIGPPRTQGALFEGL
jgi:DNA-binding NtrC family response regulator